MSEPLRLERSAIVIWWWRTLSNLWPILLFSVIRGNADGWWFPAGVAAIGGLFSIVQYRRFRYQLTDDALIIEGGAFQRYRRVLPRARIQSVDVVQKLRHRMFGVVEVRVEVIGGEDRQAEGNLVALRPEVADRLRDDLMSRVASDERVAEEQAPLVSMGPMDLFLAGLTGGRVAILAALLAYGDDLLPEDMSVFEELEAADIPAVAVVAIAITGFFLISVLVSLVVTIVVYWGFTVRAEDERLVITRGLLEKRRAVVPIRRIQAIRLDENPLRRMLGFATLTVRVAGYAGGGQEVRESSTLLPVGSRDQALELVSILLPEALDLGSVVLEPAPTRALSRRLVRALVVTFMVAIPAVVLWGPAWWFLLLIAAPLVLLAFDSWRALGHAVVGRYVVVRSGSPVRKTSVMPLESLQMVQLRASPLQRTRRLSTLRFSVPRYHAKAIDLDRARASERFASLRARLVDA